MSGPAEELSKWFEALQQLSPECHLLCPRIGPDDVEIYKGSRPSDSQITSAERLKRIADGDERIKITYWNSLIFGFDKEDAGQWVDEFAKRLEDCLQQCPDCVINWHSMRQHYLQEFTEYVGLICIHFDL